VSRYVCIHGHYYQPPRENPWLEEVETQASAYPYHDWNERITAECYGPNGAARILGPDGKISNITNNYARTSFNFGPTLLSWLEARAPETYLSVIHGDVESRERFSGHGSAMAQVYNHMILPLANARDRRTQVIWGLRDFEHRFGRKAEGMWLPETAVDLETLDILADLGVRFTVLAPRQARRVRRKSGGSWRDVTGSRVDPTRAYEQRLPSGRRISLFFYDGPVSQAVAFEGLLNDGNALANRILGALHPDREAPQLVHIATDGESYGHHHRFGEMALAFAVDRIEADPGVTLTNYGEFLERHPPEHSVDIAERSSWSCEHGVERWRNDCGCSGGTPGWNQAWRAPLREALDWLRDTIGPLYDREAAQIFRDPWAARDAYISVILDRSSENVDRFLQAQGANDILPHRVQALKLLELQRHAMLMYTSCGWFFDDLSGIETVQVLQYAGRCVQLVRELADVDLRGELLSRLAAAHSNVPANGTGADIYTTLVEPSMVDLSRVAAHYAIDSLFETLDAPARVYCYEVEPLQTHNMESGRARGAVGNALVRSVITESQEHITYGVVHFGDHIVQAGVRPDGDEPAYQALADELSEAFASGDLAEAVRVLDRHLSGSTYNLQSLFHDQRATILRRVLQPVLEEADGMHRAFYDRHAALMRFLLDVGSPIPQRLLKSAELALNTALLDCFESPDVDLGRAEQILADARNTGVQLDIPAMSLAITRAVDRLARVWAADPAQVDLLQALERVSALAMRGPFEPNLWHAQNVYWQVVRNTPNSERGTEWHALAHQLGSNLNLTPIAG
jgi:alpha-amylase/alpha-mannosidase (GH57 family)